MGSRVFSAESATDTTVTTTSETQGVELTGVKTARDGTRLTIVAHVQVTLGTGATAVTPRVRRGNDGTGTVVNEGNAITGTAGDEVNLTVMCTDLPGDVSGQSYEVTVEQTGATANGTILFASLSASVPR